MSFLDNLRTYAGKWAVTATEKLTDSSKSQINRATVVDSEYGLSVCFFMKGGGQKYIPVSRDSSLDSGDEIDLDSIEILTLAKDGESDILRADGSAK